MIPPTQLSHWMGSCSICNKAAVVRRIYEPISADFKKLHGDDSLVVQIPAVLLIDQTGVARNSCINSDYMIACWAIGGARVGWRSAALRVLTISCSRGVLMELFVLYSCGSEAMKHTSYLLSNDTALLRFFPFFFHMAFRGDFWSFEEYGDPGLAFFDSEHGKISWRE